MYRKLNEHEAELNEQRERSGHLEAEFTNLKTMYEELIEKWKNGLLKIDRLQNENKETIAMYEDKIIKMINSSASGEAKLKEKIKKLNTTNLQMKKSVTQ